MTVAILVLVYKDVRTHRVFMTKINGSFIMGIFPRFNAYLFRTMFPFLGNPASYSLSCLLLMIFNVRVLKAQNKTLRHVMWSLHETSMLLSVVSPAIDLCVRYPIVALPVTVLTSLNIGFVCSIPTNT